MKKGLLVFMIFGSMAYVNAAQTFNADSAQKAVEIENAWLREKYERERTRPIKKASRTEQANEQKLKKSLQSAQNFLKQNNNNKSVLSAWNRTDYPFYDESEYDVADKQDFVEKNNKLKYFYDTGKVR